ncbi:MAG TPA: hypothetical protein VME40_05505 [Caulobacteraceae bacterium]|nr:hypothetical protein [Caulobacteraceae bacterium]
MPDAVAYPLIGLVAAGLIALAAVWPQGEGAISPGRFGLRHHGVAVAKPPSAVGGPLPAGAPAAEDQAAIRHTTTFP